MGYGNPGRRDDGLGPLFAEEIEKLKLPNVTVETNYQLTVEDAHLVSQYDVVIFVDADAVSEDPFYFREIGLGRDAINRVSTGHVGFSTHSVTPDEVVQLAHELFRAKMRTYILGIRGYEFEEFGEGLTAFAKKNFKLAFNFLKEKLNAGKL